MKNYDLFIVLEGVEYKVLPKEPEMTFSEEEAIDFVKTMRSCSYVDYINTDKGIISYEVKNVKSIFYKAVKK